MGGMRTAYLVGMVVVGAVFFGGQDRGQAQQAPAAPHTLWHFLGIPQTVHRSYDGLMNRQGEHPGLERKPRLKALADPANLASDNPAIKAAAEIKQQEDLKPQKIKAIKYLAEIACGCYPGVKEALLAALDDCTEDVRYEAAVAFCRAAGNPCALQSGDVLRSASQGQTAGRGLGHGCERLLEGAFGPRPRRSRDGAAGVQPDSDGCPGGGRGTEGGADGGGRQGDRRAGPQSARAAGGGDCNRDAGPSGGPVVARVRWTGGRRRAVRGRSGRPVGPCLR